MTELVRVQHLVKRYPVRRRGILGGHTVGQINAVDDVSFNVASGEALALVGESGCGKTTLMLSLMRLLPANAQIMQGSVRLQGQELLALDEREMAAVRTKQCTDTPT